MKIFKYTLLIILTTSFFILKISAQQTEINGPAGSEKFGMHLYTLSNGNLVVTDPFYDAPNSRADVGAVYLYNGKTGQLISTLTGSRTNDSVGSGGIVELTNGNYVILSANWNVGFGAVTYANVTTGINGVVSSSNSLVGSSVNDYVGLNGAEALPNGNYLVRSQSWRAGRGAVTLGNGETGISGIVSAANSLIGSTNFDFVGDAVFVLSNSNYVVCTLRWDNNGVENAGAATFGNGKTGVSGEISALNSLVGSTENDNVCVAGVTVLTNGNYLVSSPNWDNEKKSAAGAVSFGNGTKGTSGVVSDSNSLIGSTEFDLVGQYRAVALVTGNYVIVAPNWDHDGVINVGAITFGNGTTGTTGIISSSNSMIGSNEADLVGQAGVNPLTNGNYIVRSPHWSNGKGAVTFGVGTAPITGFVSESNSLVGSSSGGLLGIGQITTLPNGNYIVGSPSWDNGKIENVGAVTLANGETGISGVVTAGNSLIGTSANDRIGNTVALSNGNYVAVSPSWDNNGIENAGAVTFGNGTTGVTGTVSTANSLVGSSANDQIGNFEVVALSNGNYVVNSTSWNNGNILRAGAVTFGNGTTGTIGTVSPSNSLVGSSLDDSVGSSRVKPLPNGNYIVGSASWDNKEVTNAGAVSVGNGTTGTSGIVSSSNSLVGSSENDFVGSEFSIFPLIDSNFVVHTWTWDNNKIENVGAFSYLSGSTEISSVLSPLKNITNSSTGRISVTNSVIGSLENGGRDISFAFDEINKQLVVGLPNENKIVFFKRFYAKVAGRVLTSSNTAINNAFVSITDNEGQTITARSNQFGYFSFENIKTGQGYTLNTRAKKYSFSPQVLNIKEDVQDLTIIAK